MAGGGRVYRVGPLAAALLLAAACGESTPPAPGAGGSGGEGAGGVAYCDPSVSLEECPAAGIPPSACGEGFESDQIGGCRAILPAELCAAGSMATPGETSCRPVAPCGAGTWGDIQTDGDTQYVDGSYGGGNSDGSVARPWTRVEDAVAAATPGATVAIADGTYVESVWIEKPVTLWGRCPELVTLEGLAEDPALVLLAGAQGAVVRGVQVTGPSYTVVTTGVAEVELREVWIHDSGNVGIQAFDQLGPASLTVRDSLIERTYRMGVMVLGSVVEVERSVIRGTRFDAGTNIAQAVFAASNDQSGVRGQVMIRRSVVEGNEDIGLQVEGADLIVEDTIVRAAAPPATSPYSGVGIQGNEDFNTAAPSTVTVERSVVESVHYIGVAIQGSSLSLRHTVVRDVLPDVATQGHGRGINVQATLALEPATGLIAASLVERARDVGILAHGADLTIEDTIIRDIRAEAVDLSHGGGLGALPISGQPGSASSLTVRRSLVQQTTATGISVSNASALIEQTVVSQTLSAADSGLYGDGVIAVGADAFVRLVSSQSNHNTRVGAVAFGGVIELDTSLLWCNPIALAGELHMSSEARFDDLGTNLCGCGESLEPCRVLSTGVAAPAPIE